MTQPASPWLSSDALAGLALGAAAGFAVSNLAPREEHEGHEWRWSGPLIGGALGYVVWAMMASSTTLPPTTQTALAQAGGATPQTPTQ